MATPERRPRPAPAPPARPPAAGAAATTGEDPVPALAEAIVRLPIGDVQRLLDEVRRRLR